MRASISSSKVFVESADHYLGYTANPINHLRCAPFSHVLLHRTEVYPLDAIEQFIDGSGAIHLYSPSKEVTSERPDIR